MNKAQFYFEFYRRKPMGKNKDMYDFSEQNTLNIDEYQSFAITEKESLTGTFEGIATDPWPCVLIDDGGAKYFVNANYKLREFFKKTRLPVGVVIRISSHGKIDVKGGREMRLMKVEVAKNTLPNDYDISLLTLSKGLNPAEMSPTDWSNVENEMVENTTNDETRDETDELNF